MAHFINAKGSRISNSIQYVPVDSSVTIGVWGAAGLTVGPNDTSMATIRDLGPDKQNNRWFSLSPRKAGNVMVEAKQGASVWDYFQLAMTYGVALPSANSTFLQPGKDGKYTTSSNEHRVQKTYVSPTHALQMVRAHWGALNTLGERMLVAQFMYETGNGESCHNWNLGNMIATEDEPHYYKSYVPDCVAANMRNIELATNLTSEPTAKDMATIKCKGSTLLIFHPPHARCRFRHYESVADGGRSWVMKHRAYGNRHPEYPDALNGGNFAAMAEIMFSRGYFTSAKSVYAEGIRNRLGLVP
jgi:hypothetical protein